jgi:outer membrane protein OmpA-like peptidoglycan-associated protein
MLVAQSDVFRFRLLCLACLILGGLFMQAPQADEGDATEIYRAGFHESAWHFSGSSALCELTHEIPRFGRARFRRLTGEQLSFRIDAYQPVPERIEGVLREVSPPWSHAPADALEQIITIEAGLHPLRLDRRPSGWLFSTLAKGQIGSFDTLDWNDSRKTLRIQLSPINFQQASRAFKQCEQELSQDGFQALRSTAVHFALDVDRLGDEAKRVLKPLSDYVKADSHIKAIRISGHADDQGGARYNLRLSARRAKRVRDYLVQLGVESRLISQRHYGESRPQVRGRTETARAANRRAVIELVR